MSNCKVIALTNQKGGVGKTTTAVNLGVSLVQQGKKVLLIDADAQANLTMALGYNRPDDIPITLSTVMQNIIDDKTLDVSQGIIHHSEGVDLLPSNIELSGFEVRLINAMSRERVLKTYVNEVKKNYDYVLIDCMPSLGMITINALAAADSVIIPTQPHYLSAKGLELLLRSVSMVKRQINPKLRIDGILMTKYLELFLRNLLLDEKNELHNRSMHISGRFKETDFEGAKADIENAEADIESQKADIRNKLLAFSDMISEKTINHTFELFSKCGKEEYFGRTIVEDITGLKSTRASELIKLLVDSKVIVSVTGHGKGKYRFQL